MQALTPTDIPVAIQNENVELRMTEVGDMTVSFIRLKAGTDLGPALVGLPGDRCPCPHWGYLLEGSLTMRTAEGDRRYRQGEAFYWAPGHVPVAAEDCAYVDFSPTEAFHKVIDHIKGQG
jgi:hypothetical protein